MLVKRPSIKTAALFLVQNAAAEPSSDGSYYLGEISDARNDSQRWHRETPYSLCSGLRE
jgi:hypothetical protein